MQGASPGVKGLGARTGTDSETRQGAIPGVKGFARHAGRASSEAAGVKGFAQPDTSWPSLPAAPAGRLLSW